jgi:predicted DNA-binding transcriptional regulator YafY
MQRKKLTKGMVPRIYDIDVAIASGRYPSASAMAQYCMASVVTIHRDIGYMKDMLKAPIEYDRYTKGYYYTDPTFRLKAGGFVSTDDMLALELASELLTLYEGTPIHEEAQNLLDCISAPLKGTADSDWFKDRIVIPQTATAPVDKEVWNAVVSSMKESAVVTFQYRKGDSPVEVDGTVVKQGRKGLSETRRVRPYQLLFDRTSWSLYAFDEDKTEMRMFSLSRVWNVQRTGASFNIPQKFDYRALEGLSYFGVFAGGKACKVVIEIDGDPEWIREREWAPNQRITEKEDGIEITFTTNQLPKTLEWILSQGPRARPIAPHELVEQWKQTVRAMARRAK